MRDSRTTTPGDLWHPARRVARDGRKRAVALVGLAWTAPVLLAGAAAMRLVSAPSTLLDGLARPLSYVLEPARQAYWAGDDVRLLAYVLLHTLLLTLLWGYFGGRLHRLAVVELATGEREGLEAAHGFARRSWRTFAGARLALWLGFWVPLCAAGIVALAGRLPDAWGGVLMVVAVGAMTAATLVAVLIGSVALVGGFLTGPLVAGENADVFEAVTRTFTYVGRGLPRLCWHRLRFFWGVLLGSGWRLAKTLAVVVLGWAGLHLGAGGERLGRAQAVIQAMGAPPDAARLGIGAMDYVLAVTLLLVLTGLLAFWLADVIVRVVCARSAVYLHMREEVESVPSSTLRYAPQRTRHQDAEAAGFVQVARIGEDA